MPPERKSHYSVVWTTISYRTIALYAGLIFIGLNLVFYLISPHFFRAAARKMLSLLTAGAVAGQQMNTASFKREAHFVNLDGTVRVKKGQSLDWIPADYNTPLEKGDFVQTGSDGVARIIFSDGTNYVIKPDSLIVIEESGQDPVTRATRVAVQVSSGAVDLSTGKFEVAGSTSQVAFEDAVASLGQETRAVVQNDPKRDIHLMTVDEGRAKVTRGSTTVQLGQYDRVAFNSGQPGLTESKVIAPPVLIAPENMALTIARDPMNAPIEFSWTRVPDAAAYRLEISPSGMFSNLVVNKTVTGQPSTVVTGLEEGFYYWQVSSIDRKGVESQPSGANRFNLVQQASTGNTAFLKITQIIQHGRVVEVDGVTAPGSTVIISAGGQNQRVFNIAPDGTFRSFTAPLAQRGSNEVTVTAVDRKGEVNTVRKAVVVQ